jgi:glycosyltransferase involved in cell wall biosynthesis
MGEVKEQNYDISIIVPTFNNTHYIDECISSLMESSSGLSYEILVGIDGCQKTYDHLKDKVYPGNIKIFYFKENRGPYLIKNTLANESSSEDILFFDSDDVMLKPSIPKLIELSKKYEVTKFKLLNFVGDFDISNTKGKSIFAEGVFHIKKSLFLSMNGFEPWMCAADSDFMARLYKKNLNIFFTNDILFHRRIHTENLTKRGDTGLGSKLRQSYWKISKNKKGDGNPSVFNLAEFAPIINYNPINDSTPFVETDEQKEKDLLAATRRDTLNKVFNKTKSNPQKEIIEKKPSIIDYEKINKLFSNRVNTEPRPKKVVENKPENRQEIIDQKITTNKKMAELLLPGKKNRRNGDPLMTFGKKR